MNRTSMEIFVNISSSEYKSSKTIKKCLANSILANSLLLASSENENIINLYSNI